jgi:WhiB family redox-sensing transcriptional regulator
MSRTRRRVVHGEPWVALAVEVLRSTPSLPDAACATAPGMFDAEHPDDVEAAITLCRQCPVLSACKAWLAESNKRWAPRGVVGGQHRPWPYRDRDDEHDLIDVAG